QIEADHAQRDAPDQSLSGERIAEHGHDQEEQERQAGGEQDLRAEEERDGVGAAVARFAQAVADRVVAPGVGQEACDAREEALEEALLAAALLPPRGGGLLAAERLQAGGHGVEPARGAAGPSEGGGGA